MSFASADRLDRTPPSPPPPHVMGRAGGVLMLLAGKRKPNGRIYFGQVPHAKWKEVRQNLRSYNRKGKVSTLPTVEQSCFNIFHSHILLVRAGIRRE